VDSCSRTTGSARTFVLFSASALHEHVIDGQYAERRIGTVRCANQSRLGAWVQLSWHPRL
jgi:hypothetical protein